MTERRSETQLAWMRMVIYAVIAVCTIVWMFVYPDREPPIPLEWLVGALGVDGIGYSAARTALKRKVLDEGRKRGHDPLHGSRNTIA